MSRFRTSWTTLTACAVLCGASVSQGAPAAPHTVIAAVADDGVFLEGYEQTEGGAPVLVELLRGGVVIANAGPFPPPPPPAGEPAGSIEINHLGEPTCWNTRTPDLVWGDTIRITQNGIVEESAVRLISVDEPFSVDATTVELRGIAYDETGFTRVPILELGGRLINPAFQNFFGGGPFINIPDAKIGTNVSVTSTVAFDDPGNVNNGNWTATISFAPAGTGTPIDAAAAASAALAAEPEIAWAGATEITETGVVTPASGGPVADCVAAPSGAFAVVAASPATLLPTTTNLVVQGTARLDSSLTVRLSFDDQNPATPPVVTSPVAPSEIGNGMLWTATVPATDLDPLDNGTLSITPVFSTAPPVPALGGSVQKQRGPGTIIGSGPGHLSFTNQRSVSFAFTSTHPADGFACSLDGAPVAPCASPFVTPALSDGLHTLRIRATAGTQVGSFLERSWTVDTVAPTMTIDSPPAAFTRQPAATVQFRASEDGTTFTCALDGGAGAPCPSPFTTGALADGRHTLSVFATDRAGNVGPAVAATWTVDRRKPSLTVRVPGLRTLPTARTGGLRLTGRCDERCTLTVRARFVVPNATGTGSRSIRLELPGTSSAAGASTNLRLRLNAVQLRRVRQALRAGKNVRVHLTVVATDQAGNASVALPGVTLRPSML